MLLVDAKTMQGLDRRTIEEIGIPGLILMENAGLGCARIILEEMGDEVEKGCLVVAGPGNNGGDGFVIARHLFQKGKKAKVLCLNPFERFKGDALTNLKACQGLGIEIMEAVDEKALDLHAHLFDEAGLVVDAMFGTGLSRPLEGRFARAVELINSSPARVFSVDIASGLGSDSGQVLGAAVRADVTATMAMAKVGHVNWPGVLYTGRLFVIDIGIPRFVLDEARGAFEYFEEAEFLATFRPRPADGHKGTFGHVVIFGGSRGKIGAACLSAHGALRAGAGLVTVASVRSSQFVISQKLTEAMTEGLPENPDGQISKDAFETAMGLLEGKKAACIGPGLGLTKDAIIFSQKMAVHCPLPLVMDADALSALSKCTEVLKEAAAPRVLTPHPGEMARLTGTGVAEVQRDRIGAAASLATDTGCVVVLKGMSTVIASPSGQVCINSSGNSGMGTGGMGDILTGIIGALLAQGYAPWDAARLGVFVHGKGADLVARMKGPFGYTAREAADQLPRLWQMASEKAC